MTYGHHSWEDEGHVHHHVMMMKRENHGGWAGQPAGSFLPRKNEVRRSTVFQGHQLEDPVLFSQLHQGSQGYPPNGGASGALVS